MGVCQSIFGGGETTSGNKNPAQQQCQYPANRNNNAAQSSASSHVGSNHGLTFGGVRSFPAASSAGDSHRFDASQHAQKRSQHLSASQTAWNRGDKAKAKELSEMGKKEGQLMEAANRRAADAYFLGNNKGRPLGEIDLHGLYVEEALERLAERIQTCKSRGIAQLLVIVGRGSHSKDKVAKIKPAVEKLIREHRLQVAVDSPNVGCLTILFNASGSSGFLHAPGTRAGDDEYGCIIM